MNRLIKPLIIATTAIAFGSTANLHAQAKADGPDSVGALLLEQEKRGSEGIIEDWNGIKTSIKDDTGFAFGIDYTTQIFAATSAPDGAEDFSGGGIARVYGRWEFVNPGETANNGSLNWKVEHRHSYTDVAPRGHLLNLGYVGAAGATFSDQEFRTTNLYWRQAFGDQVIGYLGYLYVPTFTDAFELISPWSGFTHLGLASGQGTTAFPSDSAFGAMLGGWLTDNLYVIGSIADRNSDPTDPFRSAETFFDESEYWKSVEIGLSSSQVPWFRDNVHVTFWHVDESTVFGAPEGWGVNFAASKWIDKTWMPFVRAAYAEDAGSPSLLETSVTAGAAFHVRNDKDLFAVGFNWQSPNEVTFGGLDLDNQFAIEMFYRTPVGQNLEVTPSVQLLFDPALNPAEDFLAVFGFRGKLAF
ncbi:MAG: porin [Verrucomicrobiales bacterium]|jgi:porin